MKKTFRVWRCSRTGQLHSSLEDVEVGEGEGLEDVLRDTAQFYLQEDVSYIGWECGVFEFEFGDYNETQSLFLTVEKI